MGEQTGIPSYSFYRPALLYYRCEQSMATRFFKALSVTKTRAGYTILISMDSPTFLASSFMFSFLFSLLLKERVKYCPDYNNQQLIKAKQMKLFGETKL